MENTIVSKYVKEDTAEVLKVLGELAKRNELWLAIKEVALGYMMTEQAYAWLIKELAKLDAKIIRKAISIYPELLERAENALRVHSPWRPLGVRDRAEKARVLALQEVQRFIEEHKCMQGEKLKKLAEIQEKRLEKMMELLERLKSLVLTQVPGQEMLQLPARNDGYGRDAQVRS